MSISQSGSRLGQIGPRVGIRVELSACHLSTRGWITSTSSACETGGMHWPRRRAAYDTGVPAATPGDLILEQLQPFLAVAFGLLALVTVHPLGATGKGLLQLGLIVVSTALMLTARMPDHLIWPSWRLPIATTAALTTGALMGLAGPGFSACLAYMVATHTGFRFPPRIALRVLSLAAALGVTCSLLAPHHGNPWWGNFLVFAAVLPGMTRRARTLTFAAVDEMVRATQRAAASEAQSRALAERAEIARDIHDVLAHSLSGVSMQLSLAEALFDAGESERGRAAVHTARSLVVEGLDGARAAVSTLRGDTIDPVVAIQGIVGSPDDLDIIGMPRPLPGPITHALVRTAQEATTNARRHAPGAIVRARLEYAAKRVGLEVRNAASDAPSQGGGSGLGLVGMRERAAGLGGTVTAGPLPMDDPEAPGGWLVTLEIPIPEPEESP